MTTRVAANPEVTISITSGRTLVDIADQRILVVGQQTSVGTATSGDLETDIQNDNAWDTLFGENSMVAAMVRSVREVNTFSSMDVISLDDDGSAVDSTGTIVFTGTATEAGEIDITVGSDNNHVYTIPVAVGDTASDLGTSLAGFIAADTKVPVTSINTAGSVALTAVNGGTEANFITLKFSGEVAGITTTLTAMSGGATNPDLTSVFDVIGSQRYQTIIWPDSWGYTEVTNLLDNRFNVDNDVQDGVAIVMGTDTLANRITAANAENSQSLVIFSNKSIDDTAQKGGVTVELNYVQSSYFGSLRALRRTTSAPVADITIGGGRDAIGGIHNSSKPYFNTPFPIAIPDIGLGWTNTEVDNLLDAGSTVMGPNRARTGMTCEDVVTTYKTDTAGNEDDSFKFLNFVDTISAVREFQVVNLRAQYAQFRLIPDSQPIRANVSEVNALNIKAFMMGLYTRMIDFSLTQGGDQTDLYKFNLIVVIEDFAAGKVLVTQKVPIITQLRQINGVAEINFGLTV